MIFKQRMGPYNVQKSGEASFANREAAGTQLKELKKIIEGG